MTEKQKKKPVLTVLDEELKKAEKEHGDNSEQAIFVKCAITGVKHSGKGDFQIDPRCFSYQLCPDQYVGQICKLTQKNYYSRSEKNNIFDYLQKKLRINEELNLPDYIFLLILESPHKDEFDENGKPIGPAMGTTGRNIRNCIGKIFDKKFKNHHLILMNAIPFQCSLGVDTDYFRDDVFDAVWKDELIGRFFFETRLGSLLHELAGKNVVIVNACTKDTDDKKDDRGRKHNVTESIKNVIGNCKSKVLVLKLWEARHPSSRWWFKEEYWEEIPIGR